MNDNNKSQPKHHRRSIRLKGYDYSQPGGYFITICTYQRICLFGEIFNDKMILNPFGKIVDEEWRRTAMVRPNIECDAYIVMPNHMHGIIIIHDTVVGAHCNVPLRKSKQIEQFRKSTKNSIPTIIKLLKSTLTKQINELRGTPGEPVWQRGYYEHIIRNDVELLRIREYIKYNPLKWEFDRENPDRKNP